MKILKPPPKYKKLFWKPMPIQKTKIAEFDIRKEVEKAHQEIMSHPANISDPVKVEKLNLLLNNLDKSLIKIRKYKNNTIEKMLLFKTLSTFEKKNGSTRNCKKHTDNWLREYNYDKVIG